MKVWVWFVMACQQLVALAYKRIQCLTVGQFWLFDRFFLFKICNAVLNRLCWTHQCLRNEYTIALIKVWSMFKISLWSDNFEQNRRFTDNFTSIWVSTTTSSSKKASAAQKVFVDGHHQIDFTWKQDAFLPNNNKWLALKQLDQIDQKFSKNPPQEQKFSKNPPQMEK